MGISIYPRDGTDVSALRRNADAAMYEAKHAGKDRVRFYTARPGRRFPSPAGTGNRSAPRPRSRRNCASITSPSSRRPTTGKPPTKLCRAGRIPASASCRPASSSPWPKRPDSSSGWASGCCAKRAANAAGGRTTASHRFASLSMSPRCSSPAPDFVDTVFGVLRETGLERRFAGPGTH